jgi:hypothetical protein
MQFSLFTITLLASIAPALAGAVTERDLHTTLYFVDDTPAQSFKVGESVTQECFYSPFPKFPRSSASGSVSVF